MGAILAEILEHRSASMGDNEGEGSSDESIGRPKQWREGRYQKPGESIGDSVKAPDKGNRESTDRISTPVTHRDYEQRKSSTGNASLGRWNVGFAGLRAPP
jgi:hypothetical protein